MRRTCLMLAVVPTMALAAVPARAADLGGTAAVRAWSDAPPPGVRVTASRRLARGEQVLPGSRAFRYLGAQAIPAAKAYGRYVYRPSGVTGFAGVSAWAIATRVTGGRLVLRVTGDGTTTFRLRVDGRATRVWRLPRGGYRTYDLHVRLPSRAAHEVLLDLPGAGTNFMGAQRPARGRLSAPRTDFGPRTIVLGDSWTMGTPLAERFESWVQRMGHELGLGDIWASGIGGTGYTNPGLVTTFGGRVQQDVLRFRPATVVVAGGANDFGASREQFDQAAGDLLRRIRAALPSARIVVIGPFVPAGNQWPQLLERDGDLRAAATSVGGQYISALDLITGNGSTLDPKADGGNASRYIGEQDHPNRAGYAYVGHRLATQIEALP